VTDPRPTAPPGEDRSRGQLLLVGAVAIAIIILGIVVVYNTVLFTDTNTASQSIEETTNARDSTEQIRKEVKRLAAWQKKSKNYSTASGGFKSSTFETDLKRSIRSWSRVRSQSHAHTGPVFVNITFSDCSLSCNMTRDPNPEAIVLVRWQESRVNYTTVIRVRLPDNSTVAPSLRPAARPAPASTDPPRPSAVHQNPRYSPDDARNARP